MFLAIGTIVVIGICLYAKNLKSHSQHSRFTDTQEVSGETDSSRFEEEDRRGKALSTKQKQQLF